jgi:hypothetical protein
MSVSVPSLTASAVVGQAAPIATFSVSVSGAQNGQQFYLTGKYGTKGISSVSFSGGSLPDTVTVQFKDPASLGAGTYSDTVQISV